MRSRPADLGEEAIRAQLSTSWGLHPPALTHVPLGGGSHHWFASAPGGTKHFITVDDLDNKPWLGDDRETAFDGLRRSYETARVLRDLARLDFVVAPLPDAAGSLLHRLDSRFTVAVFPFVQGQRLGPFEIPVEYRARVTHLLEELHAATPCVQDIALSRGLALPGRAALENALGRLDRPWRSGPFGERARRWLSTNEDRIRISLDVYSSLAGQVASSSTPVVTHGEPHAGNVMRTDSGLLLVDWDTVALAPVERDLWFVDGGSGRARRFYELAWQLSDVAAFVSRLSSAHQESEDASHAWSVLAHMQQA